jgi:two-component system, NtrC family, response regulator HydG
MTKLLIVDDDPDVLLAARLLLKRHISQVDIEKNPDRLPFLLGQTAYDAVLLDMNFARPDSGPTPATRDTNSGLAGFAWLDRILDLSPGTAVVLFTAYGDVEMAVRAIKAGASDFVLKPWENDRLVATIVGAVKEGGGRGREGETISSPSSPSLLISRDPVMRQVLGTLGRIAPTEANVLILGENGTGKDLLAREIHRQSLRRDGPLVAVDLGALTESLFESELFGHVKGAFTDARSDRAGRFEEARGGTIFLDEIGNVSLAQQARLLTVLEQRTVTRVGSNRAVPVDVRLICATNANLAERVAAGRFRQDLLYRINTIELALPPLRERPADLPELADQFLRRYSRQYNRPLTGISPTLLAEWSRYAWPGNVRELQHTIERAVILAPGPLLEPDGRPLTSAPALTPEADPVLLETMEKRLIQQALHQHGGRISEVARALGLSRQALYRRMDKYGL